MRPYAASRASADSFSLGYTLAMVALGVMLLGLAVAYWIDGAARSARQVPDAGDHLLVRTLGGRDLAIPQSWFRYGEREAAGFSRQLDLRLEVPMGPDGASRVVDVTLMPRSGLRPSASLLDTLYLHLFLPEQVEGAPGLVGKPLKPSDGYDRETVWYDPLSPAPFVAKCGPPIVPGTPARCLRAVYLAPGIAASYGFDQGALEDWRRFDAAIRPMLEAIGALDHAG